MQFKFYTQLSWAWKKFYNLRIWLERRTSKIFFMRRFIWSHIDLNEVFTFLTLCFTLNSMNNVNSCIYLNKTNWHSISCEFQKWADAWENQQLGFWPGLTQSGLNNHRSRLEISNLRMFAANIWHFGTSGFSFVEYLVNGCRYFPNISYLDT